MFETQPSVSLERSIYGSASKIGNVISRIRIDRFCRFFALTFVANACRTREVLAEVIVTRGISLRKSSHVHTVSAVESDTRGKILSCMIIFSTRGKDHNISVIRSAVTNMFATD